MNDETPDLLKQLQSEAEQIMAGLSERQRDILRLRYGLTDGECHSLKEIAAKYQVTRERIRQIQNRALEKLSERDRARFQQISSILKQENERFACQCRKYVGRGYEGLVCDHCKVRVEWRPR